jgi:hypothetical protein
MTALSKSDGCVVQIKWQHLQNQMEAQSKSDGCIVQIDWNTKGENHKIQ